jgi:two-component system cell cycle sensor histidine kinase/response regulator CckA
MRFDQGPVADHLAALIESSQDAIFTSSLAGIILSWNPAGERIYGYPAEEAIGQPASMLLPAEFQHEIATAIRALGRGERVSPCRTVSLRKDGQRIPVSVSLSPLHDEHGQLLAAAVIVRDLSERDRSEASLLASEERYRQLFEASPNPMWVYSLETLRFLAVNQAAVRHYGYTREEFLEMGLLDIRPAAEIPALLEDVTLIAAGQPGLSRVWRHRRKDGGVIEVEVTATSLSFDDREARLVSLIDVTEKRSLEERFRQAQKMEAVGRLAGGVAHDFNSLLLDRIDPQDDNAAPLREIKKAAERAAVLTNQLLTFSRRDAPQPQAVDLNALLLELHNMLRRLIPEHLEFVIELSPGVLPIHADPGGIEQLVANLVVNACDAMAGGGRLTIATASLPGDGGEGPGQTASGDLVELRVVDTGAGMSEATKARLFEPFFTTKPRGQGTGLGLATVYGIVQSNDGSIRVDSEPGCGAAFHILFPRYQGALPATLSLPETRGGSAPGAGTVLVVEDEASVRDFVVAVLRDAGYRALAADCAASAFTVLEETPSIDLLLTDVMLPGIDGRTLAVRMGRARPGLKTIYMSGYHDDDMLQWGIAHAAVDFLPKPFTALRLLEKVREALKPAVGGA